MKKNNIGLILIDFHYFDAEWSKKSIVTGKMHKIIYCLKKTDGGHQVFVFHQNFVKFKSTHNIHAYL